MKTTKYRMKGTALVLGAGALFISPAYAEPGPQERPPHAQLFQEGDKNGDGVLTQEEITAVRPDFPKEAFTRMDKNSDGKIAADEFGKGPGRPGGPGGPGDPEMRKQRRELMKKADTDGDKEVTRAEWDAVAPDDAPADAFEHMDRNDDGVLNREDRPGGPSGPGGPDGPGKPGFGPPPGGPHGDPRKMFEEVDTNDDGKVTLKEHKVHAAKMAVEHFNFLDKNGDGVITKDEIPEHGPGGPKGKHPDGPPPAP